MKKMLLRFTGVLLAFVVAFGLAELMVRLIRPQETGPVRFAFQPELGAIPVPLQKGKQSSPGSSDFTYSNNSLGFRGSREYAPKKAGVRRILCLGDSFTYGIGVNDDQTFAVHLERHLRETQSAAEVINAGCPGKGTDYELKLFQSIGAKLRPDVTILSFFSNDFQDNERGEYYEVRADGGLQAKPLDPGGLKTWLFRLPGYNWLISWSHAANLMKQIAVNYLAGAGQSGAAAGLVVSYRNEGEGLVTDANRKLTEIHLAHLREAVRRSGSDLAVFYIPAAGEVESFRRSGEISRDERAIKEILATQGGSLLSLTPLLAAAPEPIEALYYAEGHWTPRSHALAGEFMATYLDKLLKTTGKNSGGQ